MRYAIFCYDSEAEVCAWSKEKDDQVMQQLGAVTAKLAEKKQLGPVARLAPTTKARTVRKGGAPVIMDGPFAETKEQLLGFYVVDCESMDAAIEVAKELARASGSAGAFEIRPMQYFDPGAGGYTPGAA
ncbi:MAG TPA: YciI family protein [Kofleriaceae bacterium]|jgi:hypothetical protein|nr:YciI family protein [Kofleriaceae bacterium]